MSNKVSVSPGGWSFNIIAEINALKPEDLIDVNQDPKEGDEPVCELSSIEKGLYTLCCRYGMEYEKLKAELNYKTATDDDKTKLTVTNEQMKVLRNLMWYTIRERTGTFYGRDLGLRSGFMLVKLPKQDDDAPRAELRKLLSGLSL